MSAGATPIAMTIAGSDSGGGAGIQADLKTFTVLDVYGVSALTAVTAQNTLGVTAIATLEPEMVAAQIDAVMSDIGCGAAKTGMLSTAEIARVVADRVAAHGIDNLVVDPVMIAKGGEALLQAEARGALIEHVLPRALALMPNLHEAGVLLGREVTDLEAMHEAAREIASLGPRAVVVKGGHLQGEAADVLYTVADRGFEVLRAPRVPTGNTHGTGCTFSAAIAAYLARGESLKEAVRAAKHFITAAISHALSIGAGHGPTGHIEAGRAVASSGDRSAGAGQ